MALTVRPADVARERDVILDILVDGELEHATPEHYDWRYLACPDGHAKVWLAEDAHRGAIGAAAAFPRRMRVQGTVVTGWVLGDFAIRRAHRTLGPAVALQRACMELAAEQAIPVLYDHPSTAMVAIYRRLGIVPTGSIVRLVRRLRVDDKIEQVVGPGLIARGMAGLANRALHARDAFRAGARGVEVSRLQGRFDDRVERVDLGAASGAAVAGVRDRSYLDWRYLDHPTIAFESWIVEEGEDLLGFAVLRRDGEIAVLAELCAVDARAARALVEAAVRHYRGARCLAINAPALDGSALAGALANRGFVPRERTPFVVTAPPDGGFDGVVNVDHSWFYSDGDRDV